MNHPRFQKLFYRGQNPAATDTRCRLLSDYFQLNTLRGDLHILHSPLCRPHTRTDIHPFQGRPCGAGTAQQTPLMCQHNFSVCANVNEQNIPLFFAQLADIHSRHNIRTDISGHRRQTVKPGPRRGMDSCPGC